MFYEECWLRVLILHCIAMFYRVGRINLIVRCAVICFLLFSLSFIGLDITMYSVNVRGKPDC